MGVQNPEIWGSQGYGGPRGLRSVGALSTAAGDIPVMVPAAVPLLCF